MADIQVPESWRDRLGSLIGERRDLLPVVAVLIAVVAVVLALRFRTPPAVIAPPATEPALSDTSPEAAPGPPSELFVHVAGAVRKPGLYGLAEGSRVADALEAAGGVRRGAALHTINLAEMLVDGAKIEVPRKGAENPAPAGVAPAPTPTGLPGAPASIDLNAADAAALEAIPGIGPVLAAAIVQHRDEHGPYPSVDALIDVSGIGPATLEEVRPFVRI